MTNMIRTGPLSVGSKSLFRCVIVFHKKTVLRWLCIALISLCIWILAFIVVFWWVYWEVGFTVGFTGESRWWILGIHMYRKWGLGFLFQQTISSVILLCAMSSLCLDNYNDTLLFFGFIGVRHICLTIMISCIIILTLPPFVIRHLIFWYWFFVQKRKWQNYNIRVLLTSRIILVGLFHPFHR